MKIAIIGAFGTAKTALGYRMAANSEQNQQSNCILEDIAYYSPYPAFNQMALDSAYFLVCHQIAREQEAKAFSFDNIICFSSAIDPILYLNLRKIKQPYDDLRNLANNWMRTYDLIFYITSHKFDDAHTDEYYEFQEQIDKQFDLYLEEYFKNSLNTNIYKLKSDDVCTQPLYEVLVRIVEHDDRIRDFL
jgi:hypothetical protein